MADAVRIDPGSCTLSGLPLTMPSLSGEASALFWALAWVAQGPRSVGIRIWSDCLVALGQVNGSFGIAGANSVAEHARSLLQAVQVSGIAIEDIRHVRSHQGHPANECVDSFAKWACKRNSVPPAPEQLPFAKAAQTGQLAWWWCVIDSVRCPDHWPLHVGTDFLDQDRFADTCPPTELESCSWFGLPAAGEHTAKGSSVAFGLRLMSVNVQTLASTSAASEEASDQAFERCRRAELGPDSSQVHHDLDWGQSHVDHYPVRLDVTFLEKFIWPQSSKGNAVDRDAMGTPEGCAVLRSIWDSVPLPPWSANVHRHWALIEQYVRTSILKAFPARRGSCRSSYFSTSTWMIRQRRVWLRRQLLRLRQRIATVDCRAAWRAWATGRGLRVCLLAESIRSAFHGSSFRDTVADLRKTKSELRASIRQDRKQRIEQTASEASACPVAHVVSKLRPLLGPPKRRCRSRQGLPLVLAESGEPAKSQEEAEQIWIRHFSGLEDGHVISPVALARHYFDRQFARNLEALSTEH
eukprot:s7066_g3.t1